MTISSINMAMSASSWGAYNQKLSQATKQKLDELHISYNENTTEEQARALINQPKVILADEPTGSLDKKSGQDVIELLKSINQNNTTVIIVTHDYEIAKQCCRTILLSDGKAIV